MPAVLLLGALVVLPLLCFVGVVAFAAVTGEHDTPSMIFYGVLVVVCLYGAFAVIRRVLHHRRRLERVARGEDLFGFHVTPDCFCALIDAYPHVDLVVIPREAVVHVQYTQNHFYSENVSKEERLVTLRTTDPERPLVILSFVSHRTTKEDLRAALTDVLGAPWSDDVERLDDEARDKRATMVRG